jgi:ribosomal protein S18 acetylase RimI-like enzyme
MKEIHMPEANVRVAIHADEAHLRGAVADEQDYERALHDTRRPGLEVAERYLAHVKEKVAHNRGALLVAELNGVFAGYAACWVEHDDNVAETEDSNHFGYVSDTYVVPEFRGHGVVARLLEAAESHLRNVGVLRMRIGVLANNASARRAYEKYGFGPYEVLMEKKL